MGKKLFLKHLFNSINNRKAQPILLVTIIALAVIVCISTINLKNFTQTEVERSNYVQYGEADFEVSVNTLSPRFILVNDAKNKFGDKADICGVFSLPVFYGENNDFVFGAATNFADVDKVFDLYFSEVQPLYDYQVSSAAFISQKFSEKYGVHVGDIINVSILSTDYSFTVYGISTYQFVGSYDVMIDTSSVLSSLKKSYASIGTLFSDIDIANQIYFHQKTDDQNFKAELINYYSEYKVTGIDMLIGIAYGLDDLVFLMILVVVFFVICVIYCCCFIIASQRVEETNLFFLVGAKPYMLNLVSMCELALYWLVGSIIGVCISYPLGQTIINLCDFTYCINNFSLSAVAISTLSVFVATESSLAMYILTDTVIKKRKNKKKKEKNEKKSVKISFIIILVLWLFVLVLSILLPFLNDNLLWYLSIIDFVALIFAITISSKLVCLKITPLFFKKKKRNVSLRYALKNVLKTNSLSNLPMIVSLLVISLSSIMLFYSCYSVYMNKIENMLDGDYLIMYTTDSAMQKLQENDTIKVTSLLKEHLYQEYKGIGRYDIYSASDPHVFEGIFTIDELPQGNEAYIFGMYAKDLDLEIGQTFTIHIGTEDIELIYAKEIPANTNGIVLNAEYLHIPYNYTVIQGKNISHEETYAQIVSTLSEDNTIILDVSKINKAFLDSNSYMQSCCLFMLFTVIIFSSIGLFDSIVSSYRSRKEQFYCFGIAGMSKRNLRKMKGYELLFVFACGILVGLIFVPLAYFILYEAGISMSANLLWIFSA